jgi:glutathione synthase/RimK-type ligase-like ATP-grasp enzyme
LRAAHIPVDDKYLAYCETALTAHARELCHHFPDALWVSDFWALQKAEYKALQLEVAGKLGFRVPETLFTSNSAEAKEFVKAHPQSIVKTSAHIFPVNASGEGSMFFAKKVPADGHFNYEGLEVAPAIFQQAIDHDVDIRVTVVGKKVFAAEIHASDTTDIDPRLRDWRASYMGGSVNAVAYELPKSVEKKCVALMEQFGLLFGAIDLIRDKKGELWFLENNPNGQWAFIELATGQPIGRAIATLLDRE